jgi:N-acetyl-anhydromuramyl-L-alanine amidase AmpD
MDIGVKEIDSWHKERGWSKIGYHDVIRRDGTLEFGRAENEVGAHARGYNSISVGICMVGGVDNSNKPKNNFTQKQFKTLKRSITFYKILFPEVSIIAHYDVNPDKACPSFNVEEFLMENTL